MVVASRVAGRFPASEVVSRARRSSIRRVREFAPTKSCSRQGWKSSRCPTSLKKARRTSAQHRNSYHPLGPIQVRLNLNRWEASFQQAFGTSESTLLILPCASDAPREDFTGRWYCSCHPVRTLCTTMPRPDALASRPSAVRRGRPRARSARPPQSCRPRSGQGASSGGTRPQPRHLRRSVSLHLHVSEGAFFHEQRRSLYAQVGLRALGQTLAPLPPCQFPLHGAKHRRAYGAVVLTGMAA